MNCNYPLQKVRQVHHTTTMCCLQQHSHLNSNELTHFLSHLLISIVTEHPDGLCGQGTQGQME